MLDYAEESKRIARLLKADREGRVFASPCRIGDKIQTKHGHTFTVERMEIGDCYSQHGLLFRCGNPGTDDYMAFYESELGETVFLFIEEPKNAPSVSMRAVPS